MGVCISSDDKYFHMKSGIGERGNSIGDLHHECRGTRYSYFGREFDDEQQLQMENARLREGRLLLLQKALAPT